MSAGLSEPFRRELADPAETGKVAETEFEKPRGINKVEIRNGFVTVHVSGLVTNPALPMAVAEARLRVLKTIGQAGISIDFLKLTENGLSFVAPESLRDVLTQTLDSSTCDYGMKSGRCIVLAHAANMRDEEGLIARVVSEVIGTGVEIDHLGDMHDRVLLVMDENDGRKVASKIEERLIER